MWKWQVLQELDKSCIDLPELPLQLMISEFSQVQPFVTLFVTISRRAPAKIGVDEAQI